MVNAIWKIYATIKSRVNSSYKFKIPMLVVERITGQLPMVKIDETAFDIPAKITLADPTYFTPGEINVLLGVSIFWELICKYGQIRKAKNTSIFQETLLGWIISGLIQVGNMKQCDNNSYCGISVNTRLLQQLKQFWEIEEVESVVHRSAEEKRCEEHFVVTHGRDKDGRISQREQMWATFCRTITVKNKGGAAGRIIWHSRKPIESVRAKAREATRIEETISKTHGGIFKFRTHEGNSLFNCCVFF